MSLYFSSFAIMAKQIYSRVYKQEAIQSRKQKVNQTSGSLESIAIESHRHTGALLDIV